MKRVSLFQRSLLAVGTGLLIALAVSATLGYVYVLRPLAERSADDFSALLVLSARTWAELPPDTRPAFVEELQDAHALAVSTPVRPASVESIQAHPYLALLHESLHRRLQQEEDLRLSESPPGQFHVDVRVSEHWLRFSFTKQRITPRPNRALIGMAIATLSTAFLVAFLLARHVSAPVRALEASTHKLATVGASAEVPDSDIRELHNLGRAMQAMANEVAIQQQHQQVLLAGVSHDLRTPLSRMKMAIGMMEDDLPSTVRQRLESDIAEMDLLIGAQLTLSRAQQVEAAQPISIQTVLQEWVDAEQALSPIPIRLRMSADLGERAVASTALRRILGNLIQNATRYGATEVQVVVRKRQQRLFFAVRDNGPGIAPELRDAVFRPFYRIDASRQRATGGAGLGLAIARQLAETHGWRLRLVNRAKPGCAFWLCMD
ncbi:MAG: hypothetical protein J0L65_00680 [Xanthomonadales bacterium]|jgi:two-component system, OmpR family, osmolarity sensor histidine kinase EnvZ|nr:hypothetical protein [Xanthomonadales bacterium]HRD73203.1 ATP-binding protein [Aquimonas sp.]